MKTDQIDSQKIKKKKKTNEIFQTIFEAFNHIWIY